MFVASLLGGLEADRAERRRRDYTHCVNEIGESSEDVLERGELW